MDEATKWALQAARERYERECAARNQIERGLVQMRERLDLANRRVDAARADLAKQRDRAGVHA